LFLCVYGAIGQLAFHAVARNARIMLGPPLRVADVKLGDDLRPAFHIVLRRALAASMQSVAERREGGHRMWRSLISRGRALRNEIRDIRTELLANHAVNKLLAADLLFAQTARDPKHIVRHATHAYSQNYEDAIIAEIYSRIGERSRVFVEIGVETGLDCNTRALLERGWTGLWIDGNTAAIEVARSNMVPFIENGRLKIVDAMVTKDNVQKLISAHIGEAPIDFLSLDVDYNTSHIWRSVTSAARVACIEYNASFAPPIEWEVPYDPARMWDGTNQFGASLKTLERIGREKGLALVGCDFHGVNAFFVAEAECGDKFLAPFTAERHFEPPRYALVGHRGHPTSSRATWRV
jgi:hypothetical protein